MWIENYFAKAKNPASLNDLLTLYPKSKCCSKFEDGESVLPSWLLPASSSGWQHRICPLSPTAATRSWRLLRIHNSPTIASRDSGMGDLVLQDKELLDPTPYRPWDAASCLEKLLMPALESPWKREGTVLVCIYHHTPGTEDTPSCCESGFQWNSALCHCTRQLTSCSYSCSSSSEMCLFWIGLKRFVFASAFGNLSKWTAQSSSILQLLRHLLGRGLLLLNSCTWYFVLNICKSSGYDFTSTVQGWKDSVTWASWVCCEGTAELGIAAGPVTAAHFSDWFIKPAREESALAVCWVLGVPYFCLLSKMKDWLLQGYTTSYSFEWCFY